MIPKKCISIEEYEHPDGYWIMLKAGWKSASDPVGALHTIHEETKAKAHREDIMKCDCENCVKDLKISEYISGGGHDS